jgi:uncharacterized repeat protein (TIGR03803 family)
VLLLLDKRKQTQTDKFRFARKVKIMSFTKFTQALLLLLVGLAAVPPLQAQTYTVLYSFTGGADGALPEAALIQDSAGNLYGTTVGGEVGITLGSVFKLSHSGKFTLLHSFGVGGTGGAEPFAGLVRDSAGNLYGTTFSGGASGAGTIFKLNKKNTFSVLYSFAHGADGWGPTASLILDPAGNLYGTASNGGNLKCGGGFGCGVVFKLNTTGNETVLHSFGPGEKKGEFPYAGLLRDAGGNLYGTTTLGGHANFGTVFKLDPAGNETVLYTFQKEADGKDPWSTLIRDAAGNFYGTTTAGGKGNCGTNCGVVFKLDTSGTETVLYAFTGKSDGGNPSAGLVMDAAGNLYGTTFVGGNKSCGDEGLGCGVVFKLDPSGNETVLYTFSDGTDGGSPVAGLIMDTAGSLYGTASRGGNLSDCQGGGCGVVFKITPR